MLLAYGLPKEAADLFREVSQRDPQYQAAFAGLGEAEFDLTHYVVARDALRSALRLSPGDAAVQKRLDVCERILALDPTARGLGAAERFHRSQAVLTGVLDALDKCPAPSLRERLVHGGGANIGREGSEAAIVQRYRGEGNGGCRAIVGGRRGDRKWLCGLAFRRLSPESRDG